MHSHSNENASFQTQHLPKSLLSVEQIYCLFVIDFLVERYSCISYHLNCRDTNKHNDGFHLHLLDFPFVYHFNSRIGVLVHLSFENDQFRRISSKFQHHFKMCLLQILHKKECSFFGLLVQIQIQLLLELEANLLHQNVNELEFELSRMQMKSPFDEIL